MSRASKGAPARKQLSPTQWAKRVQAVFSPMIAEVEPNDHQGDVWFYLRAGFSWDGCHAVHEDSEDAAMGVFANVVACDCAECGRGIAEEPATADDVEEAAETARLSKAIAGDYAEKRHRAQVTLDDLRHRLLQAEAEVAKLTGLTIDAEMKSDRDATVLEVAKARAVACGVSQ